MANFLIKNDMSHIVRIPKTQTIPFAEAPKIVTAPFFLFSGESSIYAAISRELPPDRQMGPHAQKPAQCNETNASANELDVVARVLSQPLKVVDLQSKIMLRCSSTRAIIRDSPILVDHDGARHPAKQGGAAVRVTLDEGMAIAESKDVNLCEGLTAPGD
jgi:hypothetical protein